MHSKAGLNAPEIDDFCHFKRHGGPEQKDEEQFWRADSPEHGKEEDSHADCNEK